MSRPQRQRLDDAMVQRGLASSRSQARALIMAGEALLPAREGVRPSPGTNVGPDEPIELKSRPRYVSRGGEKLEHALERFSIDLRGMAGLDIGASTGGFTDCLLQRGARKVYALDVGYGQLDALLRSDPRVVVMERINARNPYTLPEKVDIVTADVSFISLRLVLPVAVPHLVAGGKIVALFKPQFEAERDEVGKGGVIRDPQLHAAVLGRFIAWAVGHRFRIRGLTSSPILGDKGNREFLFLLEPDR